MSKLLDAFRNPVTRTRALIWTGTLTVVFGIMFFVIVGITSSYWFCAEVCHKVQDDSIYSYQESTHSKVSCLACHMPVAADPVTFMLHKAHALKELVYTVQGTYTIPLNPGSHLALDPDHMGSEQCTQCHNLDNREVTPSAGILISHDAHSDKNISCTHCHNRVGHNEKSPNFTFQNVDPQTGELNVGHPDFMEMTACYRCHRLNDDGIKVDTPLKASGECAVCHTPEFDLVPEDHKAEGWMGQHGKNAVEIAAAVDEAIEYSESHPSESEPKSDEAKATAGVPLVDTINDCYTCHTTTFCNDCHGGVEMPHPGDFLSNHADAANDFFDACASCHGGPDFCTLCHHSDPNVPGWTFDTTKTWLFQHDEATYDVGAAECFECHSDPTYCSRCHVGLSRQ